MRSSNSKTQDNVETINPDPPVENGLPPKEDCEEVREVAAQVVEDVLRRAQERTACSQRKGRGCGLQKLPTIQIDTVSSLPPSPDEWTPPDDIDVQLPDEEVEQELGPSEEELREELTPYIEELLSEAMAIAEKKVPEEVQEAAEKVVEEVISKASEVAHEKMQNGTVVLGLPGLPSFKIDTVVSAPPSPESEEESPPPQKKWSFKMEDSPRKESTGPEPKIRITFENAPDDVKRAAEAFVKEIVGRAVAIAEEKSVPTVPFNFEDPEVMKTSGPWYVRAREAFLGLLRHACFCTPRRAES